MLWTAAAQRQRRVPDGGERGKAAASAEPAVGVILLAKPRAETGGSSGGLVVVHGEEVAALVDAGVNGVELVARLTRVEQGARVVRGVGGGPRSASQVS